MASGRTLSILGCGNMGSAILSGIVDATATPDGAKDCPFSRIIACTKSKPSASKLQTEFISRESPLNLEFRADDNTAAASEADVVILGCKPYLVETVLAEEGLAEALAGKLVVSIIAGKTIDVLTELVLANQSAEFKSEWMDNSNAPVIARAIPNVAASVRESMTFVELPESIQEEHGVIIEWMFSQIGKVKILGSELFDCGTMVAASLATMSVAVDGILDGCVAEGIRRSDATEMATQCLLGLARMLQEGHHPAVLRESISSPRGCTIQGLLTVEKAGVRSAFAESVINGTQHLKKLQK